MGVYIPPGSGGNDNGKGSGSGDNTLTIPNPASFIPQNPSLGLRLWGPLVPASDNLPALYFLTSLQIGIGLLSFNKVRYLRRANLERFHMENTWQRRTTKWLCAIGGSYLIYQSGIEMSRLAMPYDPWYDEAKFYRKLAIKNGDNPSWWFGATGYYKPMNYKEWFAKIENWFKNQVHIIDVELENNNAAPLSTSKGSKSSQSPLLSSLSRKGKYSEIYQSLHDSNVKRCKILLEELKDVNELNKAERLDLIMEGKSSIKYNEEYLKPHIQLGNHRIDTDEEFEMVWLNFEPWDELKMETDYDIRLVPRWRWSEDEDVEASANESGSAESTTNSVNEVDESHI
mmetsp:Transcript_6230/g.7703  ORF Transcript_6230/g.7703 Transcript_6230/m.7703 type:complete len:342 (+) Transcript_6230:129-1154(+)